MHDLIPYLKYLHGLFNGFVALLFIYQGWLGLTIRKHRVAGQVPTLNVIKRHRKTGPIFALMGIAGFFAGATIVYLHEGRIFEHPGHFIIGLSIAALILTTSLISKKIRGGSPTFRTPHLFLGIIIICLYFIQAFIGISMLLRASH
jgi:hypothetical protein